MCAAKVDDGAGSENNAKIPSPENGVSPSRATAKKISGWLNKIFALLGILAVLGLIGAGVGYLEIRSRLLPASDAPKTVEVTIPRGADAGTIGRILQDAGAIRSATAFRYLVQFKKSGSRLKAGEQIVDASMNTMEVMESLIRGNFKQYTVTVPEGLRMTEIADIFSRSGLDGLADRDAFMRLCTDKTFVRSFGLDADTLEGYLFPETYNFTRHATLKKAVTAMVERFFAVWARYSGKAESSGLTRHQIITLASIVEKETGQADERPLIASVFLNRLKKGMRLETDPTVIYGIENFNGNLTRKDLETPTPYNTYVIAGLPPGPIASPGEASIRAVLEPAETDFLFFVSKNDGSHQFSKTLKEHNRAVNQYQRRASGGN